MDLGDGSVDLVNRFVDFGCLANFGQVARFINPAAGTCPAYAEQGWVTTVKCVPLAKQGWGSGLGGCPPPT